jgi:sugar transferase (PEP-CTERM system associated)
MSHVRIFRHYVHTPYLLMSASEVVLLAGAAYIGHWLAHGAFPAEPGVLLRATTFALTMLVTMTAMGVYESRMREGYSAMMLRSAVALFLLGGVSLWIIAALFPFLVIGRDVLLHAAASAFALLAFWRLITPHLFPPDAMKQRVLVLGTGFRAQKIAARMRRRSDQRAFTLCGFLDRDPNSNAEAVSSYGATVLQTDLPLLDFCRENAIDEIVVAIDERRRNQDAGGGIPLDELMDCRLSGIGVCDVQQFIEREACKLDVDLLRPSWLVFADGFSMSPVRVVTKRIFDILACLLLLLIFWPVMIIIALAIFVESGLRGPVLLRQERVGLKGKCFNLLKFRSMVANAEPDGKAVWASHNEDRVTRVGKVIRKSRLDELPQLFNVLTGEMSFVGPRPERPVFVTELNDKIPYYTERHRVKPGITGWAQLCYPYGASVHDAKEKLQYDLYYLKNHSILLDLIILLQTVEVVLVGDGAR